MPPSDYQGLTFSFADTIGEAGNAIKAMQPFLDPEAPEILNTWLRSLQAFQSSHVADLVWQIPQTHPVMTRWSKGECELSGKGLNLQGRVAATWAIRKLAEPVASSEDTELSQHVVRFEWLGVDNSQDS